MAMLVASFTEFPGTVAIGIASTLSLLLAFDTEAENTFVLDQDTSKKEITLVTCTDGGKKRLIIKGEIEE